MFEPLKIRIPILYHCSFFRVPNGENVQVLPTTTHFSKLFTSPKLCAVFVEQISFEFYKTLINIPVFRFGLLLPGVTLATTHSIHDQRVGINKNAG